MCFPCFYVKFIVFFSILQKSFLSSVFFLFEVLTISGVHGQNGVPVQLPVEVATQHAYASASLGIAYGIYLPNIVMVQLWRGRNVERHNA